MHLVWASIGIQRLICRIKTFKIIMLVLAGYKREDAVMSIRALTRAYSHLRAMTSDRAMTANRLYPAIGRERQNTGPEVFSPLIEENESIYRNGANSKKIKDGYMNAQSRLGSISAAGEKRKVIDNTDSYKYQNEQEIDLADNSVFNDSNESKYPESTEDKTLHSFENSPSKVALNIISPNTSRQTSRHALSQVSEVSVWDPEKVPVINNHLSIKSDKSVELPGNTKRCIPNAVTVSNIEEEGNLSLYINGHREHSDALSVLKPSKRAMPKSENSISVKNCSNEIIDLANQRQIRDLNSRHGSNKSEDHKESTWVRS